MQTHRSLARRMVGYRSGHNDTLEHFGKFSVRKFLKYLQGYHMLFHNNPGIDMDGDQIQGCLDLLVGL